MDLASSFGNSIATFPTIINFEFPYGHYYDFFICDSNLQFSENNALIKDVLKITAAITLDPYSRDIIVIFKPMTM